MICGTYSAGPGLFIHGNTKAKMCAVRPVVLIRESNMQLASKVFAGYMCHITLRNNNLFKYQKGLHQIPELSRNKLRLHHNHRKDFYWGYNYVFG